MAGAHFSTMCGDYSFFGPKAALSNLGWLLSLYVVPKRLGMRKMVKYICICKLIC